MGFSDNEEYPDAGIAPVVAEAKDDSDDDDDEPTGPDPEEVRAHIKQIKSAYTKLIKALKKNGKDHKRTVTLQNDLTDKFMELKLAPKFIDRLTMEVRELIDHIRSTERGIMKLCVKDAKMPRKDFIASFPGNEINTDWVKGIGRSKKPYAKDIKLIQDEVLKLQNKLSATFETNLLNIGDMKEINRKVSTGEAKARRAKKGNGRSQPATCHFYCKEIHKPRSAFSGSYSGR